MLMNLADAGGAHASMDIRPPHAGVAHDVLDFRADANLQFGQRHRLQEGRVHAVQFSRGSSTKKCPATNCGETAARMPQFAQHPGRGKILRPKHRIQGGRDPHCGDDDATIKVKIGSPKDAPRSSRSAFYFHVELPAGGRLDLPDPNHNALCT